MSQAKVPNSRAVTWLALGDSITYLNDHLDETGFRVTKGYLTRVVEQLPWLTCINRGFNGWGVRDFAARLDEWDLEPADVFSIFLGTNDWNAGAPLGDIHDYQDSAGGGTICGAFRVVVDRIRTLSPRAKLIFVTPLQRGDFVYLGDPTNHAPGSYRDRDGRSLSEVARAIRDIATAEGADLLDLYHSSTITPENAVRFKRLRVPGTDRYVDHPYPEYLEVPFDPARDPYPYPLEAIAMTYDGLHPSDKGNQIIADLFAHALQGLEPAPNP